MENMKKIFDKKTNKHDYLLQDWYDKAYYWVGKNIAWFIIIVTIVNILDTLLN